MSTPPYSSSPPPDLTPPYSPPAHWGPFTAGELIRRTFEIYRQHFSLFFGIAAIAAALSFLIGVPNQVFAQMMRPHANDLRALFLFPLISFAVLMVTAVFTMFIVALANGATFLAVHGVRMGSAPSVISALEATSPRIGSLFSGALLVYLRLLGWTMLAAIPALILAAIPIVLIVVASSHAAAVSSPGTQNPGSMAAIGVITILIVGVLAVAICIFAYWIYARYVLFVPVIMEEELSGNASIKRSIQLSKGSRGRIYALLGLSLFLTIITVPISLGFAFYGQKHAGVHGLVILLLSLLINALFAAFISIPVAGIGIALCYFDLRARHANAAVMAPPIPPPPVNLYPSIPASAIPSSAVPPSGPAELTYDVATPMPPAAQPAPIPPPPAVGEPNTGIAPTEPELPRPDDN